MNYEITKATQRAYYSEIIKKDSYTFRIYIVSDPYEQQCIANIKLWSGERWEEVYSILPGGLQTRTSLAYIKEPLTFADFSTDRNFLLSKARLVMEKSW